MRGTAGFILQAGHGRDDPFSAPPDPRRRHDFRQCLLALAVHMLGARYGLDLGGLWRSDTGEFMPAGAAIAWWLIATRRLLRRLFHRDADGQRSVGANSATDAAVPDRRRGAGAGGARVVAGCRAKSDPDGFRRASRVSAALCLGALMAFPAARILRCARRRPRRLNRAVKRPVTGHAHRRQFITALGGAAMNAARWRTRQEAGRIYRLGVLVPGGAGTRSCPRDAR